MINAAFASTNALSRPNTASTLSTASAVPPAPLRGAAMMPPLSASSRLHHVLSAQQNDESSDKSGDKGDKPNRPLIRIPLEKIQSVRDHVMDSWGAKLDQIQDKLEEFQDTVDEQRACVEEEAGKWEDAANESVERAKQALDPVRDVANESVDKVKAHLPKSTDLANNSAKNLAEGNLGKAYGSFLGAAGARLLEEALKNVGTQPPSDGTGNEPTDTPPNDELKTDNKIG